MVTTPRTPRAAAPPETPPETPPRGAPAAPQVAGRSIYDDPAAFIQRLFRAYDLPMPSQSLLETSIGKQRSPLIKGFIVWGLFSLAGWLAIPEEWLPLAAHCVGFGYYLVIIYGKMRWLVSLAIGAVCFAATAYLTVPADKLVAASHIFMYAIMAVMVLVTIVSLIVGTRRARKEYQEFVRELLRSRENKRKHMAAEQIADLPGSEPPMPEPDPIKVVLEEELREARVARDKAEAALVHALSDAKRDADLRRQAEYKKIRAEKELQVERQLREEADTDRNAAHKDKETVEAAMRMAEKQAIQAERALKMEQKARQRADRKANSLLQDIANREAKRKQLEQELVVAQLETREAQEALETRDRQMSDLQEIVQQSPATLRKFSIEDDRECSACKRSFNPAAGVSGSWSCGRCSQEWRQRIAGHVALEDKCKALSAKVKDQAQTLAASLQTVEELQGDLKTTRTRLSEVNEVLDRAEAENRTLEDGLRRAEQLVDNMTGKNLSAAGEDRLKELENLHYDALKVVQREQMRRQIMHESSKEEEEALKRAKALEEQSQCKICLHRKIDTLFLPCRHQVCCKRCANKVSECPICRATIQQRLAIFLC